MRADPCLIAALVLAAAACDGEVRTGTGTPPPTTESAAERVVARSDIVSDEAGAATTDPLLINAWGLAFDPMGAAWMAATGTGISAVYDANGLEVRPAVTIPAAGDSNEASAPTGLVLNEDDLAFEGDRYIFVSEDGGISGWQQSAGDLAVLRVDNSSQQASYKGAAIARDAAGNTLLFAADFHNAKIDVFDATYAPVTMSGAFEDADLPDGFAPFNIENVNGWLVVTYALQDDEGKDDVPGSGNGFVDLYGVDGSLLARLISEAELNSPWGVVMTPASFGAAPSKLLVGNFGDGTINVYTFDMATAELEGPLLDDAGAPLQVDGLWALDFAPNGASSFSPDQLYFTAGPQGETHGVFGRLETRSQSEGSGAGGAAGVAGAPGAAGSEDPGTIDY